MIRAIKHNTKKFSEKELIEQIINFHRIHGRTPTKREAIKSNGLASESTFSLRFGSFNKAIIAAGFEPNPAQVTGENIYSDEELFAKLRKFVAEIGHIPTESEFYQHRTKDVPKYDTYKRRFGSFENALKKSGIKFNPIRYRLLLATRFAHKAIQWITLSLREEVNFQKLIHK